MIRLGLVLSLGLALSVVSGCGPSGVGRDGNVVGGPCSTGGCAAGSTCLTSTMYPGGTCSVSCASQSDCPGNTVCVSEGGGQCVLPCGSASDCRAGYGCTDRSTISGGHANVCIL